MKDKELAAHFILEIDNLLQETGHSDDDPHNVEYRQTSYMARALAAIDYSSESKIQDSLRQRLLDKVNAREKRNHKKEFPMQIHFLKRHPVLSIATALLIILFLVALISPGIIAAAAQEVTNFINELELGNFTSIQQTEPDSAVEQTPSQPPEKPEIKYQDDLWILRTSIGNFGGAPSPGRENVIQNYYAFSDTQDKASFRLLSPAYLPEGYAFREGMITPTDWVFLFYDGPQGDIVIVQMPVFSHTEKLSENSATSQTVSVGMITDDPILETLVNGIPAGWVEGTGLMWETDGISYLLGCVNLGLEETILIAESLE